MGKVTLNAYLFFAGNCREAMEFYRDVFGGKLTVQNYEKAPKDEKHQNMKGQVIHAALMGGEVDLMASDSPYPDKIDTGKVSLSLSGTDEQKLRTMFDKLSKGGKVNSPLKKEFWGDTFGMLTDKYDVDWMVNIGANVGADKK